MTGKKHSIKTRKKMSFAHKGKKNVMYGKKHSDQTLDKMRKAHQKRHKHRNC